MVSLRGEPFIFYKESPMFDGANNDGWVALEAQVNNLIANAPKCCVLRMPVTNVEYPKFKHGIVTVPRVKEPRYTTRIIYPHDITLRNGINVIVFPVALPTGVWVLGHHMECGVFLDADCVNVTYYPTLKITIAIDATPNTTIVLKGGQPILSITADRVICYKGDFIDD